MKIKIPVPTELQLAEFTQRWNLLNGNKTEGRYIHEHLDTLCRAWLLQKEMASQEIPVIFSAQTIQSVTYQVVMKKVKESLDGRESLPANTKLLRRIRVEKDLTHASLQNPSSDNSHVLVSCSPNLFNVEWGESVVSLLAESVSANRPFQIREELTNSLQAEYHLPLLKAEEIALRVEELVDGLTDCLPRSILEAFVLLDTTNLDKYVYFSKPFGKKMGPELNDPELMHTRLMQPDSENIFSTQLRLFAPTLAHATDNAPIKTLRIVDHDHRGQNYRIFKQIIESFVQEIMSVGRLENGHNRIQKIIYSGALFDKLESNPNFRDDGLVMKLPAPPTLNFKKYDLAQALNVVEEYIRVTHPEYLNQLMTFFRLEAQKKRGYIAQLQLISLIFDFAAFMDKSSEENYAKLNESIERDKGLHDTNYIEALEKFKTVTNQLIDADLNEAFHNEAPQNVFR